MGMIETEYSEIRNLTKAILAGTIDKDTAALALKGYSECGKRTDQIIKVMCLSINHGAKAAKLVNSKNLLSDGTAIDMNAPQIEEKIKCSAKGDTLVNRDDCLDFSGDSRNIDGCQKCEHFSTTRKQTLA